MSKAQKKAEREQILRRRFEEKRNEQFLKSRVGLCLLRESFCMIACYFIVLLTPFCFPVTSGLKCICKEC